MYSQLFSFYVELLKFSVPDFGSTHEVKTRVVLHYALITSATFFDRNCDV